MTPPPLTCLQALTYAINTAGCGAYIQTMASTLNLLLKLSLNMPVIHKTGPPVPFTPDPASLEQLLSAYRSMCLEKQPFPYRNCAHSGRCATVTANSVRAVYCLLQDAHWVLVNLGRCCFSLDSAALHLPGVRCWPSALFQLPSGVSRQTCCQQKPTPESTAHV